MLPQPTPVDNPNGTGILICLEILAQFKFTAECREARPGMFFPLKIAPHDGI